MEFQRIRCPACDKGEVEFRHRPAIVTENLSSTVNGRRARVKKTSREINEVTDPCGSCGKTAAQLTILINRSPFRGPTNEEVRKRIKEAGLPTRI